VSLNRELTKVQKTFESPEIIKQNVSDGFPKIAGSKGREMRTFEEISSGERG